MVTGYLSEPARHGAKVGTMSRRLSAIKFAHQLRNLPDPTRNARVVAVWEGVRRTHGTPRSRPRRGRALWRLHVGVGRAGSVGAGSPESWSSAQALVAPSAEVTVKSSAPDVVTAMSPWTGLPSRAF